MRREGVGLTHLVMDFWTSVKESSIPRFVDKKVGKVDLGMGKRSIGMGKRSIRMGKRSLGIGNRSVGMGNRSIGMGRRTIGMGKRSIGMGKRSISEELVSSLIVLIIAHLLKVQFYWMREVRGDIFGSLPP